jgi:AcrR family transcriptional regulator
MKAAAKLFKEKGYRGASLNDIAEAIGADRASLYYYVSGKRELFDEMVGEAVRANVTDAERIRDNGAPAPERLRQMIVSLMRAYEEHYPYLYIFVQEDLSRATPDRSARSRELARLGKRYDNAVTAVVQEGLDDGSFVSLGSAHVVAYGIIGMMNWSHRWFRINGGMSGASIGEALADMVLGGLVDDE